MAVRWIIGRAGTGKTAQCVREIREDLVRDPLGMEAGALLLITPEQATFSAERLLLTGRGAGLGLPVAGTFRAQVLSFRRLAMLIAGQTGLLTRAANAPGGRGVAKPMDDVARIVLLDDMVRRHRSALSVFGAVADRPGFIRKLDATLRELRQHGHTGTTLREVIAQGMPGGGGGGVGGAGVDDVMRRKLQDLATLLDAWSNEVEASDAVDFEHLMHQAALKVGAAPLIAGGGGGAGNGAGSAGKARVWVDGFSALSAREMRLLSGLALHARDVAVTLLADPDSPAIQTMRSMAKGRSADGKLLSDSAAFDTPFARTERLHRRLIDAFRRHGVAIEGTTALRRGHRFCDPALTQVESALFGEPARKAEEPPSMPPAPEPPAPPARGDTSPGGKPKRKDSRRVEPRLTLFDLLETPAAEPAASTDRPGSAVPHAPHSAPGFKTGVEVWESSDPETEVRVAAQAIRDLVIGRRPDGGTTGLRYRQIGVIVPDLEGYADAFRRVFAEHAIPHFIDQRRGIAHHPLVELLRSAVAIAAGRWDRDDLLLYLKTGLAGVAPEDVALVENYVVEHGITHVPWSTPWKWLRPNESEDEGVRNMPQSARDRLARVNAVREKVSHDLSPWIAATEAQAGAAEGQDGAAYIRALRGLLETLQVEAALQAWIDKAHHPESPAAELAQLHEQAWRGVRELLDLLERILAGKSRTLQEIERLLNTALESLTLGLIPPTVDQVLVSSVMRSRLPELEVVFILGALEGQFPKVVDEDPILSDAQREAFNARSADPIGEGSDRQLLEMPFFDYTALTRAGRLLVVSYPIATRAGKAVVKSCYVGRLRELLGESLRERRFDAAARTAVDRIGTIDDLLAALAIWGRQQVHGAGEARLPEDAAAGETSAPMDQLYNWVVRSNDPAFKSPMSRIWPGIAGKPEPCLSPDIARRFYPPEAGLYLSISQLEKFASCPMQYFLHYTLRLRPREPFILDGMQMGQLFHRILELVYRRIIEGSIDWPRCDAASLRQPLEEEVDRAVAELHGEIAGREPGYGKTRARIQRNLGIILEADRRRACPGSLRPQAVEVSFGGSRSLDLRDNRIVKLPILDLRTPAGNRVLINGKIDRIDGDEDEGTTVAVIDYKSAVHRTLELHRIVAGLALQLPVYAMVMRDLAGGRPLAALYMALGITRKRVAHAGEVVEPDSDAFYRQFQPRGIIDQSGMDFLERVDEQCRKATWYNASLNKDGSIAKTSDLLTDEEFHRVLDFARWKVLTLADDLMAGEIAPSPWRQKGLSSCANCDFACLCPFDQAAGIYRELPRLKREDALTRMQEAMQGG